MAGGALAQRAPTPAPKPPCKAKAADKPVRSQGIQPVAGHPIGHVGLLGRVWLCWPYLALFGLAWPCLALFGLVWPCLVLFGLVGLVWPCLALFGIVSPCWPCWRPLKESGAH